jgi:hypothetical protein
MAATLKLPIDKINAAMERTMWARRLCARAVVFNCWALMPIPAKERIVNVKVSLNFYLIIVFQNIT